MWPHTPRRVLKIALPTIAALGAGAAVGVAAIPSDDGFHACVLNAAQAPLPKGAVRIIDAATEQCNPSTETPVTWAQQGPPGPEGPTGPQGLTGDTGPAGGTSDDSSSSSSNDTFSTPTQAGGPSADMFLELDGIAGDSTDAKHKGDIDITSFAFSLGRGGDGTGSGSHRPSGLSARASAAATKGRLQTLRINKVYDSSSPKLFRAAATGQHIRSAVLSFRRSNDSRDTAFLTYQLTDVQVTSYDQGGKDGDARDLGSLEEEIGLTADKVRVTVRQADADDSDKRGPAISADWTVPERAG